MAGIKISINILASKFYWGPSRQQTICSGRKSLEALGYASIEKRGTQRVYLYPIHHLFGSSIFVGGGNDDSYGMRKRRPYSATKGGDAGKTWGFMYEEHVMWLHWNFSDSY